MAKSTKAAKKTTAKKGVPSTKHNVAVAFAKKPALTLAKSAKKVAAPKVAAAKKPANTTSYTIEKDVEKPARTRVSVPSPYPFATMGKGDSFLVPAEIDRAFYASEDEADKAQREELARVANRMSGASRRFTKRHAGVKLSVRTVDNGVRVWRDE